MLLCFLRGAGRRRRRARLPAESLLRPLFRIRLAQHLPGRHPARPAATLVPAVEQDKRTRRRGAARRRRNQAHRDAAAGGRFERAGGEERPDRGGVRATVAARRTALDATAAATVKIQPGRSPLGGNEHDALRRACLRPMHKRSRELVVTSAAGPSRKKSLRSLRSTVSHARGSRREPHPPADPVARSARRSPSGSPHEPRRGHTALLRRRFVPLIAGDSQMPLKRG